MKALIARLDTECHLAMLSQLPAVVSPAILGGERVAFHERLTRLFTAEGGGGDGRQLFVDGINELYPNPRGKYEVAHNGNLYFRYYNVHAAIRDRMRDLVDSGKFLPEQK